jgi:allantoin racemase
MTETRYIVNAPSLKGHRMARADILVINPNSNTAVTAGLDVALAALRTSDGPSIRCTTLAEGPFGIESQKDVELVTLPLRRMVEQDNAADAFVVACFSDPGLHVCREATRRPVFGINECSVLTALARGDRFGIIAILASSAARHQRYLRQMGLMSRLAGERPLGMSVAESADDGAFARLEAVGRDLVEKDGADVVVVGCAGMSRHRRSLEEALGVPVIDPTQAAVAMAIGAVQAGRL